MISDIEEMRIITAIRASLSRGFQGTTLRSAGDGDDTEEEVNLADYHLASNFRRFCSSDEEEDEEQNERGSAPISRNGLFKDLYWLMPTFVIEVTIVFETSTLHFNKDWQA